MLLFCLLLMKFNSVWGGATARGPSDPSRIPQTLLTGDIRFVRNFHSRFLAQDRDVVIYLPPGYDKNTWRRYAVLYMQDGQNLFDAATSFFAGAERHFDERAQALIAERAIRPLIIVGVYSTGLYRVNEYTPTKAGGANKGGEADLYGRMLVEEIKLFIDSLYRFHKAHGSNMSRDRVAHDFVHRPDKAANVLAPVDRQCAWLRAHGFVDVDCYFKTFELAIFGGRRPLG